MNKLYVLIGTFLLSGFAFGQSYNFDGLTSGSTGNFANGWVGSNTTGYRWMANSGSTPSPGTGPDVDHTQGNTTGIYMYVEASTPASAGDTTMLTSPNITVSGLTNPGLSFWYHMAGTSVGTLYIDVYDGTSWVLALDSLVGAQQAATTSPWLNKIINISAYASGTFQVRFRAVYGTSWSGDIAIDDVSFVDIPPYDAFLYSIMSSNHYYIQPLAQVQSHTFSAAVRNVATDSLTGVTVNGVLNPTNFPFSGTIGTQQPNDEDTVALSPTLTPNAQGLYLLDFYVSVNEADTNTTNDSANFRFEVSDTVYARENGLISQGIGFNNGSGEVGQMFEIFVQDTVTSASFMLSSPSTAQSVKLKLYSWNTSANTPGNIIDSSAVVSVSSGSTTWYTTKFTCDQVLVPGKYFVAVEQTGTSNMGLGYTTEFFEQDAAFYNAGTGWTTLESAGYEVSLAVRMNLGTATILTVDLGNDTSFCEGTTLTLSAPLGYSSYSWSNGQTGPSVNITTPDSNFWLQVTTSTGCAVRDTIIISENPKPGVWLPVTAGICNGNSITLVANNNPNYSYAWNNGSTDSSITVNAGGFYVVTVTSDFGCDSTGYVSVIAGGLPTADIGMDTINYCQGDSVLVTAAGSGNIYQWSNGTTGNSTYISSPGQVILTVTSPGGCVAYDTAVAIENPDPTATLSNNSVAFCDGMSATVSVNSTSGASILWSDGSTGNTITITSAGQFWVEVDLNGCMASDTGMATVLPVPVVNLGPDTLICVEQPLTLDAGSGASWTWNTGATTQTITVSAAGTYSVVVLNSDGCQGSDTINIQVEICSSVEEIGVEANNLSVYPNPTSAMLNIELDVNLIGFQMEVIDTKGATIVQRTVTSELEQVDVSDFAAGVYSVRVVHGNQVYRAKFVVRK